MHSKDTQNKIKRIHKPYEKALLIRIPIARPVRGQRRIEHPSWVLPVLRGFVAQDPRLADDWMPEPDFSLNPSVVISRPDPVLHASHVDVEVNVTDIRLTTRAVRRLRYSMRAQGPKHVEVVPLLLGGSGVCLEGPMASLPLEATKDSVSEEDTDD